MKQTICVDNAITRKVRLKSFDIIKLYAIFLVLWGHCIQYLLSSDFFEEPVFRVIYSFHMPLFMMVSGYFSKSSMSLPFCSFIKKKLIQLWLPIFSWVIVLQTITFLIPALFGCKSFSINNLGTFFYEIIKGTIGSYPFWFLKTCFICYLLAYCGNHLKLNKYLWMSLSLILSQFIPYYVFVGIMYPCFLVGMELKDNKKLFSFIRKNYIWLFLLFIALLLFWDKSFWTHEGGFWDVVASILNTENTFLIKSVMKLYRLLIGITGSLAFIGLFDSIIPQNSNSRIVNCLSDLGQYTLGIYIIQTIILEIIMANIINLDCVSFVMFDFVVAPLLSCLILLICIVLIKVIRNYSFLVLALLGNSITNK